MEAWEVRTGRHTGRFGSPGEEEHSVTMSRDGGIVVTSDTTGTLVWDFSSGHLLQKIELPSVAVSLSPAGDWLAVGTGVKDDLGVHLYHAGK